MLRNGLISAASRVGGGGVGFVTSDFDFSTTASGSVSVNSGDLILALANNRDSSLAAATNTTSTLVNETSFGVRVRVDYTVATTTGTFSSACNGGSSTTARSFFSLVVFRGFTPTANPGETSVVVNSTSGSSAIFQPGGITPSFSVGDVMLAYAAVDNVNYLTESPFLSAENFTEIISPLGVAAGGDGDMGVAYYLCDGNEPSSSFSTPISGLEPYITVLFRLKQT
jgi:hypothetical protein